MTVLPARSTMHRNPATSSTNLTHIRVGDHEALVYRVCTALTYFLLRLCLNPGL